jgi:hypothetical protein
MLPAVLLSFAMTTLPEARGRDVLSQREWTALAQEYHDAEDRLRRATATLKMFDERLKRIGDVAGTRPLTETELSQLDSLPGAICKTEKWKNEAVEQLKKVQARIREHIPLEKR